MQKSIREIIDEIREVQNIVLEFIENESSTENEFKKLIILFQDIKIKENKRKLMSLLYLIVKISDNHHRVLHFFDKIEKIIKYFSKELTTYFSNYELFTMFKNNKRLLLFLFESKIITMDEQIFNRITSDKYAKLKYPQYFLPEIKPFMDDNYIRKNEGKEWVKNSLLEIPSDFYENRLKGENEETICKYIREDMIVDFISECVHENYPLNGYIINFSIFETNSYFYKRPPTIIEYALFYGSIQIVRYLVQNGIGITETDYLFAIHSNNPAVIRFVEEKLQSQNENNNNNKIYIKCFKKSVK